MFNLSGVGRAGATRAGYHSRKVFVSVNGVQIGDARATAGNKILMDSLSISEVLNETPNTARFTTVGVEPLQGQSVVITLGSINSVDREFAGVVINRTHRYFETPSVWFADVNAIDYTWYLMRRQFTGSFTNVAPSVVAAAIVANVPGFTVQVENGLPTIDAISFTDVDCLSALTQLAKRVGGYCDVDYYRVVKIFTSDTTVPNPVSLTSSHLSLRDFQVQYDLSQVRTRVVVEGGGVNALAYCSVGETIIPVESSAWYNTSGGTVKSGTQHISYTDVFDGGGGSLVGPGASPSVAPALGLVVGAGLGTGTYKYAYTDVTASGESLPSPMGSITTGAGIADPTVAITPGTYDFSGSMDDGYHDFAYTFTNAGGETLPSPRNTRFASAGLATKFFMTVPTGPSGTTGRKLYRTVAGGTNPTGLTLKLAATIADNTTTLVSDGIADASLGAAAPSSNTTGATNQVAVSAIAVGPAAVTSRKVYRTAVNGSQLKLLTTIADNTTTTYADSTADGSLGANAPTSDTSALTQPNGQILAGATSAVVASAGNFPSTGGWAICGSQVIRFTGTTGSTLTGIPATGPGAITATISYNSTITAAPALTGIPSSGDGSVLYPILDGDEVNLLVQCDDVAAQVALAALIGGGDDGIIEDFIQDRRLSETEATARGNAQLALVSTARITIRYKCRDSNTHVGRQVTVSLGSPTSVSGTFQIQTVTIDTFLPNTGPTYTVEASSSRFSLEDLLRLVRKAA